MPYRAAPALLLAALLGGCGGGGGEETVARAQGARAATGTEAAQAVADPEAGWTPVFQDAGTSGAFTERWHAWGTRYSVTRGPDGMRVAGGPDITKTGHRVLLWAKVRVPRGDMRITYRYTRHDTVCSQCAEQDMGIATMLLLGAEGRGGAVPSDPTSVFIAAPGFNIVSTNMTGVRMSYSTDYNPVVSTHNQVRGHLMPNNNLLPPNSPNTFVFTPGVTYQVQWDKVGADVTVKVTDPAGRVLRHTFSKPIVATLQGPYVGIYHQPVRDVTYKDFTIWTR